MKISKDNYFHINVPFQKRTDLSINGFQYHDTTTTTTTTTKKQETIEFYDYCYHLKNFGFMWEHVPLERKYEIILSADEKTLTKKITMGRNTKFKITVDKSRMMHATNHDNVASISSEWVREIPIYFDIIKPGQVKYLRNIET